MVDIFSSSSPAIGCSIAMSFEAHQYIPQPELHDVVNASFDDAMLDVSIVDEGTGEPIRGFYYLRTRQDRVFVQDFKAFEKHYSDLWRNNFEEYYANEFLDVADPRMAEGVDFQEAMGNFNPTSGISIVPHDQEPSPDFVASELMLLVEEEPKMDADDLALDLVGETFGGTVNVYDTGSNAFYVHSQRLRSLEGLIETAVRLSTVQKTGFGNILVVCESVSGSLDVR